MYCSRCGKPLTEDMVFCIHCGHPQDTYGQQENASQHKYTAYTRPDIDADVERLVGVNGEYYLPKFRQFRQLNKTTSWNWASFFFPLWWFVYRKMYLYALCVWGVNILVSSMTSGAGSLIVNILAGIFGNYIYMYYLEDLVKQSKVMMFAEKEAFIRKKSGVNKGAVIAVAIISVLIAVVGFVVFTSLFTAVITSNNHFYIG